MQHHSVTGIQLVWQQTNQVQEEYWQVSGRSQPLCRKDSRDGRACGSRRSAEQPDQFAHHAKFWWIPSVMLSIRREATVMALEETHCTVHIT